jgi:hypothetical protein
MGFNGILECKFLSENAHRTKGAYRVIIASWNVVGFLAGAKRFFPIVVMNLANAVRCARCWASLFAALCKGSGSPICSICMAAAVANEPLNTFALSESSAGPAETVCNVYLRVRVRVRVRRG